MIIVWSLLVVARVPDEVKKKNANKHTHTQKIMC